MVKEVIYCLKCQQNVKGNSIKFVEYKNNSSALKGVCNICGTNISTFVSKKDAPYLRKKYGN